jgi:hypothetical protein
MTPAGSERRFEKVVASARKERDGVHLSEALTQLARAQASSAYFDDAWPTLGEAEDALGPDDQRGRIRLTPRARP